MWPKLTGASASGYATVVFYVSGIEVNSTCHPVSTSARASSFYWSRMAGLLVRLAHKLWFVSRSGFIYVDDLLALLGRPVPRSGPACWSSFFSFSGCLCPGTRRSFRHVWFGLVGVLTSRSAGFSGIWQARTHSPAY